MPLRRQRALSPLLFACALNHKQHLCFSTVWSDWRNNGVSSRPPLSAFCILLSEKSSSRLSESDYYCFHKERIQIITLVLALHTKIRHRRQCMALCTLASSLNDLRCVWLTYVGLWARFALPVSLSLEIFLFHKTPDVAICSSGLSQSGQV